MSNVFKEILEDESKFHDVAKEAFDEVDTNHSGSIDAGELEKIMANFAYDMEVEPPTKEDVLKRLENLDQDHSGKLDLNEFKVIIREALEAMIE